MSAVTRVSDLARLTVEDVMKTEVITVRPDLSVAELVELLEEERITGAPVVDADGVVVGVVSGTDVARAALEEARERSGESEAGTAEPVRPEGQAAGAYFRQPDGLATEGVSWALPARLPKTRLGARAVREIMTPATFSVRPEATLPELAGFLIRAGVHRALVLEGSRLAGLVTSMDVLRLVAEGDGGS